jgi:hypothetical protein
LAGDAPASQDRNGGKGGRAEGGVANKFTAREKPASILLRDYIFHFSTGMEMQGVEIRSARFERRMHRNYFSAAHLARSPGRFRTFLPRIDGG